MIQYQQHSLLTFVKEFYCIEKCFCERKGQVFTGCFQISNNNVGGDYDFAQYIIPIEEKYEGISFTIWKIEGQGDCCKAVAVDDPENISSEINKFYKGEQYCVWNFNTADFTTVGIYTIKAEATLASGLTICYWSQAIEVVSQQPDGYFKFGCKDGGFDPCYGCFDEIDGKKFAHTIPIWYNEKLITGVDNLGELEKKVSNCERVTTKSSFQNQSQFIVGLPYTSIDSISAANNGGTYDEILFCHTCKKEDGLYYLEAEKFISIEDIQVEPEDESERCRLIRFSFLLNGPSKKPMEKQVERIPTIPPEEPLFDPYCYCEEEVCLYEIEVKSTDDNDNKTFSDAVIVNNQAELDAFLLTQNQFVTVASIPPTYSFNVIYILGNVRIYKNCGGENRELVLEDLGVVVYSISCTNRFAPDLPFTGPVTVLVNDGTTQVIQITNAQTMEILAGELTSQLGLLGFQCKFFNAGNLNVFTPSQQDGCYVDFELGGFPQCGSSARPNRWTTPCGEELTYSHSTNIVTPPFNSGTVLSGNILIEEQNPNPVNKNFGSCTNKINQQTIYSQDGLNFYSDINGSIPFDVTGGIVTDGACVV